MGHEVFKPLTLERRQTRLQDFRLQIASHNQGDWTRRTLLPTTVGAPESHHRLHEKPLKLDKLEAQLTWARVDRIQGVIARGYTQELAQCMPDPGSFIEHRRETKFDILDQTALWINLRGAEQVVFSLDEKGRVAQRNRKAIAWRKARTSQAKAEAAAQAAAFCEQMQSFTAQHAASYSGAGDKHVRRLLHEWGLAQCNGVDAPTRTICAVHRGAVSTFAHARIFRISTSILNYISQDRAYLGLCNQGPGTRNGNSSCRRRTESSTISQIFATVSQLHLCFPLAGGEGLELQANSD